MSMVVAGNVTVFIPEHPYNARSPIIVSIGDSSMEVSPLQLKNASSSIVVTVGGIK